MYAWTRIAPDGHTRCMAHRREFYQPETLYYNVYEQYYTKT